MLRAAGKAAVRSLGYFARSKANLGVKKVIHPNRISIRELGRAEFESEPYFVEKPFTEFEFKAFLDQVKASSWTICSTPALKIQSLNSEKLKQLVGNSRIHFHNIFVRSDLDRDALIHSLGNKAIIGVLENNQTKPSSVCNYHLASIFQHLSTEKRWEIFVSLSPEQLKAMIKNEVDLATLLDYFKVEDHKKVLAFFDKTHLSDIKKNRMEFESLHREVEEGKGFAIDWIPVAFIRKMTAKQLKQLIRYQGDRLHVLLNRMPESERPRIVERLGNPYLIQILEKDNIKKSLGINFNISHTLKLLTEKKRLELFFLLSDEQLTQIFKDGIDLSTLLELLSDKNCQIVLTHLGKSFFENLVRNMKDPYELELFSKLTLEYKADFLSLISTEQLRSFFIREPKDALTLHDKKSLNLFLSELSKEDQFKVLERLGMDFIREFSINEKYCMPRDIFKLLSQTQLNDLLDHTSNHDLVKLMKSVYDLEFLLKLLPESDRFSFIQRLPQKDLQGQCNDLFQVRNVLKLLPENQRMPFLEIFPSEYLRSFPSSFDVPIEILKLLPKEQRSHLITLTKGSGIDYLNFHELFNLFDESELLKCLELFQLKNIFRDAFELEKLTSMPNKIREFIIKNLGQDYIREIGKRDEYSRRIIHQVLGEVEKKSQAVRLDHKAMFFGGSVSAMTVLGIADNRDRKSFREA